MTERHTAVCGRSDEDRTVKIKERVELASWDRGPLHTRDAASSWLFKLPKQNGRPGFLAINSSLNQCSLLQKYNS